MKIKIIRLTEKNKKEFANFLLEHRNDCQLKFFTRWQSFRSRKEINKFVIGECKIKPRAGMRIIAKSEDGKIIGYGLVDFFTFLRKKHIGIVGTFVNKNFRGMGIGKQLLLKEIEIGRKRNLKKLRATIHEHNKNSINLHKSCGFKIEGKFVDEEYDGRYRNVLSLALFLC